MSRSRQPRGTRSGGQFVAAAHPDQQGLSPMALDQHDQPTREVARQEAREFFNDIAYMAGVGPQIENLMQMRAETLEVFLVKKKAEDDFLSGPYSPRRKEDMDRRHQLIMDAGSARAESRRVADELFHLLESCCVQGGTKERHARLALKQLGFRLRRTHCRPTGGHGPKWEGPRRGFAHWESPEGDILLTLYPDTGSSAAS